ncbi:UDP-N-acetylmuramate dehydrogenase [bacterium]|nr:UDP-N-acetylmuramate dehydrogenase [bacterium]
MQIDARTYAELERLAPGGVLPEEPMAKHTSFGLGGPADLFIEAPDADAFRFSAQVLADANVPTKVVGRGTNLLVRSGGIEGAVLSTESAFSALREHEERIVAGSGVPLKGLLSFCAETGWVGLEPLAGIPGSVGGAVVMNAGSYGTFIGDCIESVTVFVPGEGSSVLPGERLDPGYRTTSLPGGAVVEEAVLDLERGEASEVSRRLQEILDLKWKGQPVGMRSAGCVFRNPVDARAWQLVDQAGLRGARIGGAVVSDQHTNFILNDRGATAEDVEELIELVHEQVKERTGRDLVLEVEIVGRRVRSTGAQE